MPKPLWRTTQDDTSRGTVHVTQSLWWGSNVRDDFSDLMRQQREAWGASIGYHRLSEHFQPAIDRLIEWLEIQPGERVLDVATGTGRAAVAARLRGAAVTAQDLAPVLLSEAEHNAWRGGFDDLRFSESDAEALPFADGVFDVVISTFGVIHAPRPAVVTGELNRVLDSGGRLGLAVWTPDSGLMELRRLLAPFEPLDPRAADPAEWGRRDRLDEFLGRRNFSRLEIEAGEIVINYPSPGAAWRDWVRNYGPFRAAYAALSPAEQRSVDDAAEAYFARQTVAGGAVAWSLGYLLLKTEKALATRQIG